MLEDFENISKTAIVTSYSRIYTDIEYEKEIYNYLEKKYREKTNLNKKLAPEIEARYKLINKLLDNTKITQVLELAAGYSSRGIIYSKNNYKYIEMDLNTVINTKNKLLRDLNLNNSNLHLISGNVLNYKDYNKCFKYLDSNKPVAIINEGLLRYLTFEEKKVVASNIYKILKKYGGCWITSDVTPKKFIENQNKIIPEFNKNLNSITSRNELNDRFIDIDHIKKFMSDIGFNNIEIHKFSEMNKGLKSFEMLDLNKNEFHNLLDNGIVAVIKI